MIPRAMVKGLRARSGRKGFCRGYGEYVADFEDIIKAAERIRGIAKETPVRFCENERRGRLLRAVRGCFFPGGGESRRKGGKNEGGIYGE
eukprot:1354920-Amorphochlora_amoeboformis.AAC.1